LCCDGSLFGRAGLERDEVDAARRHRLAIAPSGGAFEQPCTALAISGSGRRCSIYDERPLSCRRFVCRLYARHRREGGPIEARLAVVRRVRRLLAIVEGSGFRAADLEQVESEAGSADPRASPARAAYRELVRSLESDFSRER